MEILHLRRVKATRAYIAVEPEDEERLGERWESNDGLTIAVASTSRGVYVGFAMCGKNDRFNYDFGEKVAVGRLKKALNTHQFMKGCQLKPSAHSALQRWLPIILKDTLID